MGLVCKLLCFSVLAAGVVARGYDPKPNPGAVVVAGHARFTVLTSSLIRMEWGGAIDAATFAFVNRNLPLIDFVSSKDDNWLTIQSSKIKVRYRYQSNETFNSDNLEVSVKFGNSSAVWRPMPASEEQLNGNLKGTIRTLDGIGGPIELDCFKQPRADLHCQLGLISTDGYVVVDDTYHPQFDNSDWPWVINQSFPKPSTSFCNTVKPTQRQQCGYLGISDFDCIGKGCCFDAVVSDENARCFYANNSYRDLYFFGHGHDYKLALQEFTMVSGHIPLPPRYAFGIFYSRYWAYNDVGEMEVVKGYEDRKIPLDVLVTDMDWHITFYKEADAGKKDQAGMSIGWSGFTWDDHLFPDPKGFLDWCKYKGLKNTLNLHPASGIQPWEEKYGEMAKAMGINPSTQVYVPFTPTNKSFVNNWLTIVLGEREAEGIDFWWLDWQQGEDWIHVPLVNPTFWLNHIFFTNPYTWKNNTVRPFLLHRWGGLGSHRYQVGFSGDVKPSWDSLHFQVYFTLTATNVGFGYWSHDLGGHLSPPSAELYTRWVQFGAFSPIFRTHCTKDGNNDRRIWVYPLENYEIMRSAIRTRAALIPYIYSNSRYAYDHGLSLLRPMYYDSPDSEQAYQFDHQYMFGADLLVAPITTAVNNTTQMATKDIWFPKGSYICWQSGEYIDAEKAPITVTKSFTLYEIPVFVKTGSIIPMRTDDFGTIGSAEEVPQSLKFVVFAGHELMGGTVLYEDDGVSTEYLDLGFSHTPVSFQQDMHSQFNLTIGPTSGSFTGLPSERSYQIEIPNFYSATKVSVGNEVLQYCVLRESFSDYAGDCWTYDGSSLSLIVNLVESRSTKTEAAVFISFEKTPFDAYSFPGITGMVKRLQKAKELLDQQWGIDTVYQEDYSALLYAADTGRRITSNPAVLADLIQEFSTYHKQAINEIGDLKVNDSVKSAILAQINY